MSFLGGKSSSLTGLGTPFSKFVPSSSPTPTQGGLGAAPALNPRTGTTTFQQALGAVGPSIQDKWEDVKIDETNKVEYASDRARLLGSPSWTQGGLSAWGSPPPQASEYWKVPISGFMRKPRIQPPAAFIDQTRALGGYIDDGYAFIPNSETLNDKKAYRDLVGMNYLFFGSNRLKRHKAELISAPQGYQDGGVVAPPQLPPEIQGVISALDPESGMETAERKQVIQAFEDKYGEGSVAKLLDELEEMSSTGGPSRESGANTDTVPAMLTPGEFVVPRDVVDTVGPRDLYEMMNEIRSMRQTKEPEIKVTSGGIADGRK